MTMIPRLLPSRVPALILDPIVRVLIALRITPNVITVVGFFGAAAAAALIASGEQRIGGIVLLIACARGRSAWGCWRWG